MKLKLYCSIVLLALCSAPALAQEPDDLHPENRLDMEKEMQKHRQEVIHALMTVPTPESPFDYVTYNIKGGTVFLFGFTVRPSLKSEFENAVKSLSWVKGVLNEVELLPMNPVDRGIRPKALSILRESVPQAFPQNRANIRIKSLRGEVSLVGYIGEIDKKRYESALVRIQHLAGVQKVDDAVVVKAKPKD